MFLAAALSLFFAHPAPLDMPRAEAYFVKDGDELRLEDRYNVDDLWTSRAVLGRWEDDDGRYFTLSRLDIVPPKFAEAPVTRTKYTADEALIDPKKDEDLRVEAMERLSPVAIADEPRSPRQAVRGFKEVLYYEGTNKSAIVCAFLREQGSVWRLATWELAEGDDCEWARELFEKDFLGNWDDIVESNLRSEAFEKEIIKKDKGRKKGDDKLLSPAAVAVKKLEGATRERELLRYDARCSVTNYPTWRVTESEEFSVLDNLEGHKKFIAAVTNELSTMRKRYAEVMPSPINSSNVLAVARIFSDREDYLAVSGEDKEWTAAYWSPLKRELVAFLPERPAAERELMRTLRHEAFHQYFSYATSMIQPSPWINEGYAEYFEDEDSLDWGLPTGDSLDSDAIARLTEVLPALMAMDYEQFYSGSAEERHLKYRLAWSIAVFIEKGAPDVRFQPFKNLKRDYVDALFKTRDMREATVSAFKSSENLARFVAEWKKFWTK